MPLDQQIEERHHEREPCLKIRPLAVHDFLAVADECQHRQHRLHQHALLPLAPLTEFQVGGIALGGMEGGITQDNHPPINLLNQPLKGVIDVSTTRLSSRHFLSWSCCMTPLL